MCPGDVSGEDSRGKTVDGVVGESNDFLFGVESRQDDDRTKDLLPDDLHVGSDISEDCLTSVHRSLTRLFTHRLDEEALLAVPLSTRNDLRSLLLAALDITHDTVILNLRHLRTLVRVRGERVSDLELLGLSFETGGELVVDGSLDVDT